MAAAARACSRLTDILATFGALYGRASSPSRCFVNIVSYLRDDVIHVRIVACATALMAIARIGHHPRLLHDALGVVYATAAVVAAMALAYWSQACRHRPGRSGAA